MPTPKMLIDRAGPRDFIRFMNPAFEATVSFAPESSAGEGSVSRWPDWMRRLMRSFRAAPEEALDRSTGLYNRAGLFAAANEAVRTREGQPLSMVVLDFADLREVYQIYGNEIARKVVGRVVRRLRAVAGARGVAGRTGPTQFAVALPGMPEDKAIRQVQRALGRPARVEFDAGDSEIVLVPHLLVDTAEPGATEVQSLYREMCHELARIQKDELRRLNWLTSERERHSRPMSLPPSSY
jgi:diguanylate cyclase (GGDEF)-like protein